MIDTVKPPAFGESRRRALSAIHATWLFGSAILLATLVLLLDEPVHVALMLTANVLFLEGFRRGGRGRTLSPTFVFSSIMLSFGALGYFTTERLARSEYILGYLGSVSDSARSQALVLFVLASSMTLLSSMAVTWKQQEIVGLGVANREQLKDSLGRPGLAIGFGVATLVFNLLVRDIDLLLKRPYYLISTEIGGVLTYLQIPACLLLGLSFLRSSLPLRILSIGIFASLLLFSFALSSRMISLVVLMFLVGLAMSARRQRRLLLLSGVALSALLVPIPLHMRGRPRQGLVPNYHELDSVVLFSLDSVIATFANIISSFNVVALTTQVNIPISELGSSLNPLPGFLGGGIGSGLRLSASVPFAGLGELGEQGLWLVLMFFLLLGAVLGWIEKSSSLLITRGRALYLCVIPTGLAFLTAILFAQYNLRTGSRMIYLLIAVGFALAWAASREKEGA